MKAQVKGGLLDKILNTPPGGTLEISPAEARAIMDVLHKNAWEGNGAPQICEGLTTKGEAMFLGRSVMVKGHRSFAHKPGIEFPAWLADLGFRDASSPGAHAALAVAHLRRDSDYPCVVVWIAEPSPEDRVSSDISRFLCFVASDESERQNGSSSVIYAGEDEAELRAALQLPGEVQGG